MKHFHHIISASASLNPKCPICDTKYEVARIQILDENDSGVLSYLTCHHCESSFIASIVETPFGHVASGLLTDLKPDEVLQFIGSGPVTHDDVLQVHEMLDRNQLNFG